MTCYRSILRLPLNKKEFPDKLKTADITPTFKKSDKHEESNYRPVIILPLFSIVYEKCLYKQIENYMENIQCGFNVRISMWFQKRF